MITQSLFLRRVLALDAAATFASGLLLVAVAGLLEPWLGLPTAIQRIMGATFLVFGASVGLLSSRAVASPILVWAAIAYNAVFVVECLVGLAAGLISPTPLGTAFVLALAAVVAALALAERVGLAGSAATRAA